jgi:FkbM family methyltransferase
VLNGQSIVYSFGIGNDITFDLGLIRRFGLIVHAFDPTPKCVDWLSRQVLPSEFHFDPIGVADYDGTGHFVLRSRPDWDNYELNVSGDGAFDSATLRVERLATITKRLGHRRVDLLKLDIEGAEYAVLDDILRSDLDVRQLLVEFHYDPWSALDLQRAQLTVNRLLEAGFVMFARSPLGYEMSFWRFQR